MSRQYDNRGRDQFNIENLKGNLQIDNRYTGQQIVEVLLKGTIAPKHQPQKWVEREHPQSELLGWLKHHFWLMEVVGIGGCGKSSLAAWLYAQATSGELLTQTKRAFEKYLWVDAAKVESFNQFARWVLQELGYLVAQDWDDEALIHELTQRLTSHRHSFLVIDRFEALPAASIASCEAFLRFWQEQGDNSFILVTTRQPVITEVEEYTRLELAGLAESEGKKLLQQLGISETTAGGFDRLVQIAQGHPLLLDLAASWLRQEAGGKIDAAGLEFFDRLFANFQGNIEAKVEEIFTKLFVELPDCLQSLLLAVVVYRDPFGLEMAQAMGADTTIADLQLLTDRAFLSASAEERWTLHPLIANLVKQESRSRQCDRASHQNAIHYFLLHLQSTISTLEDCKERLEIFHHWCELGEYAQAKQIMDSCVNFLNLQGYYQDLLPIYNRLTQEWTQANPENIETQHNLGRAWTWLGRLSQSVGLYQNAIAAHDRAQTHFEQINFSEGKAASFGNLGNAYRFLGEYQRAIEFFQQSLAIAQEIGNRNGEASSLIGLGNAYRFLGEYQRAIEFFQQSLAIAQEIGDLNGEAASLCNLGNAYRSLGEYQWAIEFFQQSLAIAQEIGNRNGEAASLNNLGNAYYSLGKYQRAIEFQQQSLAIKREIGDRNGEANSLISLGTAYGSLGEYQRAIEFQQQSLAITREIGDRNGEAASLGSLGNAYRSLGEYQRAIEFYQQSLSIAQEIGDRNGEAASLSNLGNAYQSLGEYQRAIDFQQQSLAIAQEIGNRNGEAASLGNLGNAYDSLGEYQRAMEFHQQSLAITREIGDRNGEANSLSNLGNAYYSLGEYQRAIEFYQQSLAIKREIGDRNGEAASLNNLGNAYYSLGEYRRAIEFQQQSLTITREIGDRNGEAASLGNLGNAYGSLGEYQRAIEFQQQSLAITQEIGDRNGEANSSYNLGLVLAKLRRKKEAMEAYQNARRLYYEMGLDFRVEDGDRQIRRLRRRIPWWVWFVLGLAIVLLIARFGR